MKRNENGSPSITQLQRNKQIKKEPKSEEREESRKQKTKTKKKRNVKITRVLMPMRMDVGCVAAPSVIDRSSNVECHGRTRGEFDLDGGDQPPKMCG
jgi:hypothetical protein